MPTFPQIPNLPKIDFPKIEMPKIEVPSQEQVVEFVRDAAYAGTGLVALTAERVSELQAQFLETVKTIVSQGVERIRAAV